MQTSLQTKSTRPHQPQRRSDCGASPHASRRHHHDTHLLQVCQPHIRTTETQWQAETTGGSAQNQRSHSR